MCIKLPTCLIFAQYLYSKKKLEKIFFRPTDPNFLAYVTGNTNNFDRPYRK
jgi:hypothetical protein